MSPRTTGWLLLATAALAAFVYFYVIRGEPARQAAAERAARVFPDLDAQAITAISLERKNAPRIRLERKDGAWRLLAAGKGPREVPADGPSLASMTGRLAHMKSRGKIDDPAAPAAYGLDAGALVVTFETAGGSRVIRIGHQTPVGGNVYVAKGAPSAGGAIQMVSSADAAVFDRSAEDLRDHRVLAFEPSDVARVRITAQPPRGGTGGLQAVLERGEDGRFAIREPAPLPADVAAVDRLVSDLSLLRVDSFLDDPTPALQHALDDPSYEVRLEDAAGKPLGHLVLAAASAAPEEAGRGFRITRTWDGSVARVRQALVSHFPKRLFSLRPKRVAHFDPASVRSVELGFGSAEPVELERDPGSGAWSLDGKPVAAGPVDSLMNTLSHLDAVDIVAESMGEKELAGVGLAPPRLHVVVRGEAGSPAATSATATGDVLAELRIGPSDPLRGVLVETRDRSEILRLATSVDSALPHDREAFLKALHEPVKSDAPASSGKAAAPR